ncbi:MAG: C4-type zinc ribbon domain-containing protein [Candidatus Eisenbacteria bacterium]
MRATKDLLLKLQQLDDEIAALRADEESIPAKKEDLEEGLKAIQARVEEAKEQAIELAKKRKGQEIELESIADSMGKFQSQLFQVKSNREYEALQHEIAGLKEKSSKIEDAILETLESSEQISKAIEAEQHALKADAERSMTEQAKLDGELKELTDAIKVKDDERERLVADLDKALLTRYERIRDNKNGLAVTSVENGACGGCFRRIPPQEMQNLKRDDRIITCEGCGRLIIWRWE